MLAFCWDAPFNCPVALQGAAAALTGKVHFHGITLDAAPEMYKVWRDKEQSITQIVIDPWAEQKAT